MKILYFVDHLRLDGTQQVLRQLVEGFAAQGYEQAVVCLNDSYDKALVNTLREACADVRIVGKVALASGYGLWCLWRWIHKERFDVAVTLLFTSDVIGRALARSAGVGRVVSSLRARNTHYAVWQRWMVRQTMRWCDAVVLNSSHVRDFAIMEEGVQAKHIYVIPNGVNIADFSKPLGRAELRAVMGLPVDTCLIGSVGRLTRQKGFDILLLALSRVPRSAVNLLLIGTGEEEATLRTQATTLGIQHRVHFMGYRRDVPYLLGALDLYVHPARFEGMPNALLEAMAAGCPIVATAVDGNRELIDDGIHGWLVAPEDAGALAEAIYVALSNPAEGQRRAATAKQHVATHYSIEAMVESWERVLWDGAE